MAIADPFAAIDCTVAGLGVLNTMAIEPFAFSVVEVKFEEVPEAAVHDWLFGLVSMR
jgi:hypothetical protein